MRAFPVSQGYETARASGESSSDLTEIALGLHPRPLDRSERADACTAWVGVQRLIESQTGLARTSRGDPAVSCREVGALILAITCSRRIGIIWSFEALEKLSDALSSVTRFDLGTHGVPGIAYGCRALVPNACWSYREIMRLVASFIAAAHHFPELAPEFSMILNAWKLHRLFSGGRFREATKRELRLASDTSNTLPVQLNSSA